MAQKQLLRFSLSCERSRQDLAGGAGCRGKRRQMVRQMGAVRKDCSSKEPDGDGRASRQRALGDFSNKGGCWGGGRGWKKPETEMREETQAKIHRGWFHFPWPETVFCVRNATYSA